MPSMDSPTSTSLGEPLKRLYQDPSSRALHRQRSVLIIMPLPNTKSTRSKTHAQVSRDFGVSVRFEDTEAGKAFANANAKVVTGCESKRKAEAENLQSTKRTRFAAHSIEHNEASSLGARADAAKQRPGKLPRRKFRRATPFPSQLARTTIKRECEGDVQREVSIRGRTKKDTASKRSQPSIDSNDSKMPIDEPTMSMESLFVPMQIPSPRPEAPQTSDDSLFIPKLSTSPEVELLPTYHYNTATESSGFTSMLTPPTPVQTPQGSASEHSPELDPDQCEDTLLRDFVDGSNEYSSDQTFTSVDTTPDLQLILETLEKIPQENMRYTADVLARFEHLVHLYAQQQERVYETEQRYQKLESNVYRELRFLHAITQSGHTVEQPTSATFQARRGYYSTAASTNA